MFSAVRDTSVQIFSDPRPTFSMRHISNVDKKVSMLIYIGING